jgi:membrane protease YdiL (CAAX protease family)
MKTTAIKKLKNSPKLMWLVWPLWLIACYLVAGYVGGALIVAAAKLLGIGGALNSTLGILIFQVLIYALLIAIVFSLPQARRLLSRKTLGVGRLVSWGDIGLGIAGYVVYLVALIAVVMALTHFIPAFNASQSQELGFTSLYGMERFVGFIVFVVIAPAIEELLMRGFLYGKLRQANMSLWPAAIVVSVLFAAAHGQWNVAVDTFLLSMIACYLREITGTIWPGFIIHMLKNLLAYIMLFVVMPL